MNFRRLILPLVFALTPVVAMAAAPLRILPWDEEIAGRPLALVSGESVVEITNLHPAKRSPYFRISGSAPLFIRALDKKDAEGKAAQRACPVPEGMEHPLLLLLPDPKDPTGISTIVFNDDPAGFRWGGYRFLNATKAVMDVQLEKKIIRVPPGWKPVDLHLGGETRGIGARLGLPNKTSEPLYSAVWEYDSEVRTLCFLIPSDDARRGPVMVKAVAEDKRAAADEAAAARSSSRRETTPTP